ncbi:hypothetical protein C0W80_06800 [Photobacterium leiognathi subsp. mandapamensis]|nr:hypothetical protein C0W80_06800 [Photobacterium leiognathi subsp. mandapamensis]
MLIIKKQSRTINHDKQSKNNKQIIKNIKYNKLNKRRENYIVQFETLNYQLNINYSNYELTILNKHQKLQ